MYFSEIQLTNVGCDGALCQIKNSHEFCISCITVVVKDQSVSFHWSRMLRSFEYVIIESVVNKECLVSRLCATGLGI